MQITLVLDNVRSKENVGALFRTADGAGVGEIVLCGITPCPINRFGVKDGKVAKSALGAEECVPWSHLESCADAVRACKKKGHKIIVLEQSQTSVDIATIARCTEDHVVLVVGNEVDGVSKEVLALADIVVHIPMYGKKESLNVTTATGIALYALRVD